MRQGSLTIFFSMILLSLFSLFFSMVETLRIYEMRLESRSVTKIAIANAFSEYQPYLWKTYGILALDVGYGTEVLIWHISKSVCRILHGKIAWDQKRNMDWNCFRSMPAAGRGHSYGSADR